MTLRDSFQQVKSFYQGYVRRGRVSSNDPAYILVVNTIPEILYGLIPGETLLRVEGSTGKGNITPAPWIATFDTRITGSATNGYFPVYLFSTDWNRLYLSILLGVEEFRKNYGEGKRLYDELSDAANKLSVHISDSALIRGKINLSAQSSQKLHRGYEFSNIAAIEYNLNDLPDNLVLEQDYRRMLLHYRTLIESPAVPTPENLAEENLQPPADVSITFVDFVPRGRSASGDQHTQSRPRRSKNSNKVGRYAEELVYKQEIKRLNEIGRQDLSEKIVPHFKQQNYPGWDITSYESDGTERCIEVKGSVGKIATVELTSNEWRAACKHCQNFYLYLVSHVFKKEVIIEILKNPQELVDKGLLAIDVTQYVLDLRVSVEPS